MSQPHGSILGATKIVDHGDDVFHYNIGLMSEGYTLAEMPRWETDAQDFVDYLFSQAPFDEPEFKCAVNIYRIDVVSDESGADDPRCGGEGAGEKVKTYFDASFCASGLHRAMDFDTGLAALTLLTYVPFWRTGLVVVNSLVRGGTGGAIPIVTRNGWPGTGLHELGHTAFGLADEYDYYASEDEEGHDFHGLVEPIEPNVTAQVLLPGVPVWKWDSLIDPATPIPTMTNPDPDCSTVDRSDSTFVDGTVGAFEGARYYHCKVYRPEFNCRMRDSRVQFCAVCQQAVRDTLAPFAHPVTVVPTKTSVAFTDTQAGTTVPGQIPFTVSSCEPVSFYISDGPRRLDGGPEERNGLPVLDRPYGLSSVSEPTPNGAPRTASVWLTYQAEDPGDLLLGTVTVDCVTTQESFTFIITGNTVEPVNVGVSLCLDQSGSMTEAATGGGTKGQALQDAAGVFVEVVQPEDGIGIVNFDTEATGGGITDAGQGFFGSGRVQARTDIANYTPNLQGLTSIGAAVDKADTLLRAASSRYDEMAMVLFTDGVETAEPYLAEVMPAVSSAPRVFAVGLGTAQNLDPATLDALCQGSGGKLLLTGNDPTDTFFLLAKYFLNVVAGATNTEIVNDPAGFLAPNAQVLRVPFTLAETDTSADAILICPVPSAVEFAIETPAGDVITQVNRPPGASYSQAEMSSYFRFSLPALVKGELAREGTWYALLRLKMDLWNAGDNFPALFWYLQEHPSAAANGLPFALHFQARSNLKLSAQCLQNSYEPGAELRIRGILTEYALPVDGRATVWVEITRPDGTMATLSMAEIEPGVFEAMEVGRQTGSYRFRVRAVGQTLRGYDFTREQLVTGFTYHGGDNPSTHIPSSGHNSSDILCCLLRSLSPQTIDRLGLDPKKLGRCLGKCCQDSHPTISQGPVDIDPGGIGI